jgi:hypothetical protein
MASSLQLPPNSLLETPGRRFAPININGTNYTAPEECLYTLNNSYVEGMWAFFLQTLIKWGSGCNWADDIDIEPDCGVQWWLAPLFNSKKVTYVTLSTAMDQFTAAITNKFRTSGCSNYDISQA